MTNSVGLRALRSELQKRFYRTATKVLADRDGFVRLPVLSGPGRGLVFRFRLTSNSEGSILLGTYERRVAKRLAHLIQKNWTVWDCGTFIGYYTLIFARLVGSRGKVVAFEPDPINFRRTRDNARLNHLDQVHMVDAAIGGPKGQLQFVSTHDQTSHLSGTYVGNAALKDSEQPQAQSIINVQCFSLNQVFVRPDVPRPHFIKLDLEGAEAEALQHADEVIRTCRPILAVELHNPECDEAMWNFCQKHRYRLQSLETGMIIDERSQIGGIVLATPT